MASLKNLAGQTIWYGLSNIAARMLGFIMTPLITYLLNSPAGMLNYGEYSTLYAAIPFANVVFTYGMETAYFRFSNAETDRDKLFRTSFGSLLGTTVLLSLIFYFFRVPIAHFFQLDQHPEYITWCICIIALDTLAALPFAKLRQENRPRRYAFIKIAGILVNIAAVVGLLALSPKYVAAHPDSFYAIWYQQFTPSGFLILANLLMSVVTMLLLAREWMAFRFRFDTTLWRRILVYALPFVIVGLGGMVNETIDRLMLQKFYTGTEAAAKIATGIYSANYKIAIFISLFIQAFRMAAEPFFFNQAADKNAPKTYARVMKWFVITLCFAFLFTALFLDVWKYLIGSEFRTGLGVVPILLYANVALGVYYNLSVWYKITDQLKFGILITLIGAAITLGINYFFIPQYGMYACAWATFACYTVMMVLSYFFGQHYYPVPYPVKKLASFIGIVTLFLLAQKGVYMLTANTPYAFVIRLGSGGIMMLLFIRLIWVVERSELRNFPVIGKYVKSVD